MISRFRALAAIATAAALLSLGLASQAFGAAPAWQPVAFTGPTYLPPLQSEIQTAFVDAGAGTFTLKFGAATTAPIAFNAGASEVESALNALSSIGGAGGSVSVVGGPGGPGAKDSYAITFRGSLANTNLAEMTGDGAGLSGGDTHTATVATTVNGGPGTTKLVVLLQNIGGFESNGTVTYKVKLPTGVTTTATPEGDNARNINPWTCTTGAGQTEVTCTNSTEKLPPSSVAAAFNVPITSAPGTQSGTIELEVSGGGAATKTATLPLTISSTPAPPGIQTFAAGAYDSNGNSDTRAGAHPYSATTAIFANSRLSPRGKVVVSGEVKNIAVDLPPGFLGNPVAVPQCPESIEEVNCPLDTMVGIAQPITAVGTAFAPFPVFNTEAPYGSPGKFRFNIIGLVPLNAIGSLRSDEDYGLTVGSFNTPQIAMVYGTFFTFWGAPADPSHDSSRCRSTNVTGGGLSGCEPSDAPNTAFITSATNCAEQAAQPPVTLLHINTWEDPGTYSNGSVPIPPVTGCDKLQFQSGFTLQPGEAAAADSPASFNTNLTVPSEGLTNPAKRMNPEAKDTIVKFPAGLTLNPAAADGLGACTEAQIGLKGTNFPMPNPIRFTKDAQSCPDSSKIGTVEIKTALLEETLHGALYLAKQGDNPFGSLFAVYLVIEDPRHGIFIKLPGNTEPDPNTGQITASFTNLPQLPFESMKLNFKGGNRSPFATPQSCGSFKTTTLNTPWSAPESGPPFETEDSFAVNQGPGGSACVGSPARRPFDLGLKAGSASTQAGAHAPFSLRLTRADGNQEIDSLDITTPVGFTAKLKGVATCTDAQIAAAEANSGAAERANSSCPAGSQVGTTQVGAGAGPTPLYTPGRLYLAGPYKGAPLSVVAITPAVAGPFDLGTVAVRTALYVNPESAQITAKSDPLPRFLKGVQLRIRDIRIDLDRDNWALNPTSCEPKSVAVSVRGSDGATANLGNRFQVGGCEGLAFKPKLSLNLKGGTRRGDHPALIATLTQPEGQANIGFVQVALPHSEFLDQAHIGTVCTRVQFAARGCPAASVYGSAEAITPLLDEPLKGPVYLRSSNNKLPDLVVDLQGPASRPIEIVLAGRIDSVHGGIRNTFEAVPDAPVSKFILRMKGGKKGLLINSRNLCSAPARANVRMLGQNNGRASSTPPLASSCRGGGKGKGAKRAKHARPRGLIAVLRAAF